MSHPSLPDEVIQNTPVVYYRFHGMEQLYQSLYSKEYLQQFADRIKGNNKIKEAWLYFNNDIETHAIYNARDLMNIAGLATPLSY